MGDEAQIAAVVAARYPALRIYVTQDRRWKGATGRNMFDAIALGLHDRAVHQPPAAANVADTALSALPDRPCATSRQQDHRRRGLLGKTQPFKPLYIYTV
jgi:hypothetical protein